MGSEFIELVESIIPDTWSVHDPEMGMDCLLVCPHGDVIELDGSCPQGCVSPLIGAGLI